LLQFAEFAPAWVILRSASKIKALLFCIIAYWRVHVTRLAHGLRCLFAKRSEITPRPRSKIQRPSSAGGSGSMLDRNSGNDTALLAASNSQRSLRKMVGPGVVPRHSDFKNLDCQTALSGITGVKGFLLRCKTGTAACIANTSWLEIGGRSGRICR
jgi:hypothetical protein